MNMSNHRKVGFHSSGNEFNFEEISFIVGLLCSKTSAMNLIFLWVKLNLIC